MKKFTYMGGSYYFAQHLSSSARYTELRNLIFTVIGRQHVGWDIYNFAMADTDEERMRKFPPPPTVPLQRSKLSLGPDALPATDTDEINSSSATVVALKEFVNRVKVSKKEVKMKDEYRTCSEASDEMDKSDKKGDDLQLNSDDDGKKDEANKEKDSSKI